MLIVSGKRYLELQCYSKAQGSEITQLNRELTDLTVQNARLAAKVELLESELERLHNLHEPIPQHPQGGFYGFNPDAAEDLLPESLTADGFSTRLDEIFGRGLSVQELEARRASAIAGVREEAEAARAEVQSELASLPLED